MQGVCWILILSGLFYSKHYYVRLLDTLFIRIEADLLSFDIQILLGFY